MRMLASSLAYSLRNPLRKEEPSSTLTAMILNKKFFSILALVLLSRASHVTARPAPSDNPTTTNTGVVLFSADNIITITVPNDSLLYKISDLVSSPTLSIDTIDGLNYNAIRLLNEERCFFQGQSGDISLGGDLQLSEVVSPPQPILAISCG